jgi:hypothetical protein
MGDRCQEEAARRNDVLTGHLLLTRNDLAAVPHPPHYRNDLLAGKK